MTNSDKNIKKKSKKDMAKSPYSVILILAACLQNVAVQKIMSDSQITFRKSNRL